MRPCSFEEAPDRAGGRTAAGPQGAGTLPSAKASQLATESRVGGAIGIRSCSALVKPENASVLEGIQRHPHLRGYTERCAPPDNLLLKIRSNPDDFGRRCQYLGFKGGML